MRTCTQCGSVFTSSATGGRPRSRCDACRTNHAKIDGTQWRKLRAQVLLEEPVCCVAGCGRLSTQVDHVVPLSRAPELGLERSNLRGMCATHNASKGDRTEVGAAEAGWCTHPRCTYPETCGGPNTRWHL